MLIYLFNKLNNKTDFKTNNKTLVDVLESINNIIYSEELNKKNFKSEDSKTLYNILNNNLNDDSINLAFEDPAQDLIDEIISLTFLDSMINYAYNKDYNPNKPNDQSFYITVMNHLLDQFSNLYNSIYELKNSDDIKIFETFSNLVVNEWTKTSNRISKLKEDTSDKFYDFIKVSPNRKKGRKDLVLYSLYFLKFKDNLEEFIENFNYIFSDNLFDSLKKDMLISFGDYKNKSYNKRLRKEYDFLVKHLSNTISKIN